ncbi:aldehyde dehydrogenase family protein [Nesterenkonia sp. E16_7]|uniref:aldehyde dehydrogenase family protein n=1 Tax=unclassified Nesterenkonia TaxID=2629769 RepID=UPI001A92AD3E|nr:MULTISPECIES: aldehyde dehydrogenase family protein [unclassified Nesterenkonia]MBO0595857.1 aldehyde dehydrogenase family protein [Nesterenkonia sp. E16_10]MBO0599544.1 aldehyde dehydrogenase family protein [Nesterenkonia sp. E16_7]
MSTQTTDLLDRVQDPEAGREILDPATGERVGFAPQATAEDLDAAVARAHAAQPGWAAAGEDTRRRALHAAADAVEAHAEELARLLSREQGKPLNGPNARFEVGACVAWLRTTADLPLEAEVIVDDESGRAIMHYRPLGVVGAIGPWNWPMMISIWQIAPSLRMGNTVVIKPSGYTPLSVLALVEVLNSALPADVLLAVPGRGDIGDRLSRHPDVAKIMFTGSTETGKSIVKAASETMKRMTMELGGNDAGIVLEDADPRALAEGIFWGAFINTGQTCAALKRLYVPDAIYDEVCEALVEVAKTMPMGIGLEEQNVLGPLQNRAQWEIVDRLVRAAKDSGARVLLGGDPDLEAAGNFYPTTLVADIDPQNPLVLEEQFGPALPIIRYTDLDQAIEWANALDEALGSSVWSADPARAVEVAARLVAGTTWINKHGAVDPRIPFGGARESGFGMEFGVAGLKEVAQPHVISQ